MIALTIKPVRRPVLLGLGVASAHFAAVAVADVAGEGHDALAVVELGQDAPPERLVVAVVQQVDRLRGASDVLQGMRHGGEVTGVAA
ncbi:MAG TPA: hypothetical protein VF526_18835 [Solirubrobacteraceae bacterium]|jgi:hypothetical protein